MEIKRVRKDSMTDLAHYYREASILYLSDHANVAPIHYACEDDEFIYLAMPYFSSGSLNRVLDTVLDIIREYDVKRHQVFAGMQL
jgi:serine/threonine protein kinase